ncbi:hypothetical protein EVA_10453 [gut metagenome]|uniref:Uncharacterized protein n=1 Tax=gut metagenome TaxID=749906 RepID=J9G3M0_9ZZZZ
MFSLPPCRLILCSCICPSRVINPNQSVPEPAFLISLS